MAEPKPTLDYIKHPEPKAKWQLPLWVQVPLALWALYVNWKLLMWSVTWFHVTT
jgi:hypothetical protein